MGESIVPPREFRGVRRVRFRGGVYDGAEFIAVKGDRLAVPVDPFGGFIEYRATGDFSPDGCEYFKVDE